MSRILTIVGIVVIALVALIFVLPAVIPVDTYKEQIASTVRDQTGREITMGDMRLSVLPSLALEVDDVSFANAPGASSPQMVSLSQMAVEVQLWPLISGEVAVDRFVLTDPVINLEVDADGTPNWEFTTAAGAAPAETTGGSGGGLSDLTLGDVRLVNGTLTYTDATAGTSETISGINMSVALSSLDSAMEADGELTWNGQEIELEADVARPRALMEGGSTGVSTAVESAPVNLSFDGTVQTGQALAVNGAVELDVPSIRELAAWAGQPIDMPGEGLGPLNIAGTLDMAGTRIAFDDATVRVDEINGTGNVAIETGGNVPAITARLDVETLDLNPYLPPQMEDEEEAQVAGGEPADWSDEPINMAGLKAVNADLGFSAEGIRFQEMEIGRSALTIMLENGRLVTELSELNLYEGSGSGTVVVDASGGDGATIEQSFALEGLQAQPFLTDAADFERLQGTGQATIDVRTQGATERQFVSNLQGNGNVTFTDGAVIGFNLAALLRDFNPAALNRGFDDAEKTDFAELSGTFTITDGILNNPDLMLRSPLLRVTGEGDVNLPQRTIDYRSTPKLVASIEGQGGGGGESGLSVPMAITGPWDDMSIQPDMEALIRQGIGDPAKLREQLGGATGGITEGAGSAVEGITGGGAEGIGEALEGLTGGGSSGGDAGAPSGESTDDSGGSGLPDPGGAIKGIFGQ